MDKEIIIDGVDVSGCEFCCENPLHEIKHSCNVRGCEKDNGLHIHLKCINNPDCYYKQLKRLQAENERLKKQYNCYACDSCGGKEDYINMKRHTENAIKTVHKYSQALQEIRDKILSPEIIDEETKKLHTSEELDNIVRWHREDKLSKIKAKINEVIGEE